MEYVIGIDGGGTKTDLIIMDTKRNILFNNIAGPINLNSVSEKEFIDNITSVIKNSIKAVNLSKEDCNAICIGTAGSGISRNRKMIKDTLKSIGFINNVFICDDGITALKGAINKDKGILLVSGTGSICIGLKDGMTYRVGGWGHIIGDEGSGYDIGRKILCCVMKCYDGRIKETILKDLVFKHFNINNIEELIDYTYHCFNKKEIANVAKLLTTALKENDEIAKQIASETVIELSNHISTMMGKLNETKCSIVLNGSVILKNEFIKNGLVTNINQMYKDSNIFIVNEHDAAKGACYIALEKTS